jgi:NADH-quinone oxidoreductase subunit L
MARSIHRGESGGTELILEMLAMSAPLVGIFLAYLLFLRYPAFLHGLMLMPALVRVRKFWRYGWGFDRFYDLMFVRPYLLLARSNQGDVIDNIYSSAAQLCLACYRGLSVTQTGLVRRYAAAIAAGSVTLVFIVIFT